MNKPINYLQLIQKYIPPDSEAFKYYMVHVTLVAQKAITIGKRLKLTPTRLRFIEEAAMLHDIGIIKVDAPEIGCFGSLPYVCHVAEGHRILTEEGLPEHARIAENHIGVGGLTKEEIIERKLPLPARDMLCETIEDRIISYADLFFSKSPEKLWIEKTEKQVRSKVKKYGKRQEKVFEKWHRQFGEA